MSYNKFLCFFIGFGLIILSLIFFYGINSAEQVELKVKKYEKCILLYGPERCK